MILRNNQECLGDFGGDQRTIKEFLGIAGKSNGKSMKVKRTSRTNLGKSGTGKIKEHQRKIKENRGTLRIIQGRPKGNPGEAPYQTSPM